MKKLAVADITTLTYNGVIYGHFLKLANQYLEIFQQDFDVKIYGGITYKNFIEGSRYKKLPFVIKREEVKGGIIKKSFMKFKEVINALKVLSSDADVIIFQCYSEMPVYLALLIKNIRRKKVFMIQYQKGLRSKYSQAVYRKVAKKISGIITSSKEVANFYGLDNVIIPDYLPVNIKFNKVQYEYDGIILGTTSDWKDYEDVISSFRNCEFKVKIAGKFFDENRLRRLKSSSTPNIEIEDRYLTDNEYDDYLSKSKYVILPYRKEYEEKSSGIVLDAIYRKKPVIVPNLKSFNFVKECQLGLVYNESISEVVPMLSDDLYNSLQKNIESFIIEKNKEKQVLIDFIKEKI